ncbi:hypothetical protein KFL_000310100 [Klebsormidium nitens]|uniref:BSD domain-containing protein n=1 Tax=Klebsormidium nitens TaxID=105231 RepID=A0A1Y1HQJ2_KLENI|nr:hypothetical protein KFL_000310100 [Klebsormidium nitens]|eukprot:GAQ79459.1 hypothetical protein KFL_000310100 [Klebsormidium nitens]
MERAQSTGKLSAMAKAKTAFQTFSQRAEKLLNEVKAEIRGHEGNSSSQPSPNASKSSPLQPLPWTAKNMHEKKHEADFKRGILEISQKPEEYFLGPYDENLIIDMRAAMASAGAVLEVDDALRALRYQLVPKKMSDPEFWKRYTIAVKRIKQEVLDAAASEDVIPESSLTDSVIISRQESGLDALRAAAKHELHETPVFLPLPIPPSTTVRRLSRAAQFSRACSSMNDLSAYEGDASEQNGDSGDPWASLVSGLPGFAAKTKPKNRPSNTAGAAEYHALLWTLFEADATAEDLASSSAAGVLERPHTFAEDIQGAPADSFVAQLAEVMAGIKTEQKMAAFWLEVVKQLRKHWAERRPVPRTPVDAQPELYFCNLQQQLELLNCCIARGKRRAAAVEAARLAATAAAAEAAALVPTKSPTEPPIASSRAPEDESPSAPSDLVDQSAREADSEASPAQEPRTNLEAQIGESEGEERTNGNAESLQYHDGDSRSQVSPSQSVEASSGANGASVGAPHNSGAPKRAIREGVECAVPGMRLLATGEQMYAPVTQEGPILTEDLIKETEELVLKTGSVGHGCKQLLSDMQAFKAANPGCTLEDFVRWYSPPDFITGSMPTPPAKSRHGDEGPETPQKGGTEGPRPEENPVTPSPSRAPDAPEPRASPLTPSRLASRKFFQKGALSARMQSEGNLWQELWASAQPIPAVRQAPLFDEELAGETALDELASIAPSDLFEQLFVVALGAGFAVAQASPQAAREPLRSCLEQCAVYAAETCGRQMSPAKLERLCQVYETMEHAALLPPEEEHPASASAEAPQDRDSKQSKSDTADEEKNDKAEVVANGTAAGDVESVKQVLDVGSKEGSSENGTNRLQGQKTEEDWTIL